MASGCSDPVKERRSPETGFIGTNHSVQESWGVRLALTESGNQRGIIDAGHGEEYRTSAGSEHHLDHGIRLTLFDANGQSKTIITAQKALIHENQDIEAQGNDIITSGTTIIQTEYIKRTAKDQMIRSNRFVTITKPEETIRGEGFESDQALKKYRIFRGSGEALKKQ